MNINKVKFEKILLFTVVFQLFSISGFAQGGINASCVGNGNASGEREGFFLRTDDPQSQSNYYLLYQLVRNDQIVKNIKILENLVCEVEAMGEVTVICFHQSNRDKVFMFPNHSVLIVPVKEESTKSLLGRHGIDLVEDPYMMMGSSIVRNYEESEVGGCQFTQ